MEISGKCIAVLPLATGEGTNGTWRSQDYVIETGGQYPKKVCFNLFGDKIDQFPVAIDDTLKVSFDVESREYNGRWYTSIRAWKVEKEAGTPVVAVPPDFDAPAQTTAKAGKKNDVAPPPAGEGDDLPF